MSPVPASVLDLVERYAHNADRYRRPDYNETQVRREFIDPFFEALGWDVGNRAGATPQYQEVIHEATLQMGGARGGVRAPDYAFRMGPQVVYYVEAKKPSVDIHADPSPAYQLRRYAWTAKLPLSVLTDFQELAIYDCRYRPAPGDAASQGRVIYMQYTEYAERWDELAGILSREAVLRGDFDRWAEEKKAKRGTQAVDEAFLGEIEGWRTLLAQNIALRNPQIAGVRDLNYAVQKIIDRIIFLRICEDRGIEPYGQLRDAMTGHDIYARLVTLFRRSDDRYNSGLFHFAADKATGEPADTLTPALAVDDRVLKEILDDLYYPKSPYEFSVLGADILGNVYEQFLGSVIRLTPAHRAVVEPKPEVRKAGGVYYTPRYIVDYIVEHTVGALLRDKTPAQAARLRILDPACGSGSFLLGAYDYLLRWHLEWYTSHETKQARRETYQGPGGEWRLTSDEKKRILLNNLYGVDIDPQAVEVTKLSLLLKVLEGETSDSLQMEMFQARALPDLGSNIKCGNSLIGPDFFQGRQTSLLDDDEWQRVNPFDWEAEFPVVMQAGGFDAVIGNPPYLRIQGLQEHYGDQVGYYASHYASAVKRFDLYLLFAERGWNLLSRNGRLGYICPHKFLNSDFGSGLRGFLAERKALHGFISFGNNLVFSQATTYTGIMLLRKDSTGTFRYYEFPDMPRAELPARLIGLSVANMSEYDISTMTGAPWVLTNSIAHSVLQRLDMKPSSLKDVVDELLVGVQSGIDSVHVMRKISDVSGGLVRVFSERAGGEVEIEEGLVKPFLRGEDVHRYAIPSATYVCVYPYDLIKGKTTILDEATLRGRYPLGYRYLREYRAELADIRQRQRTNPHYWYSCHRSRNMSVFESQRILTPYISLGCNMTMGLPGVYHNTKVYSIVPRAGTAERQEYWLGLLNSALVWWFLSNTGYVLRGGYFAFTTNYLNPLRVHTIDSSDPRDVARHDRLVALVERMLALHRDLAAAEAGAPARVTLLQRQIAATDAEIDALVYELYGLTDEEVRIVEEGTKR